MAIRGTLTPVNRRLFQAADGLLISAAGRLAVVAGVMRRAAPVARMLGLVSACAGTIRRSLLHFALSTAIKVTARRFRRVATLTGSLAGRLAAVARRRRRGDAQAARSAARSNVGGGARAQSTLLWSDDTAAGWSDGAEIRIYR